MTIPRGAIDRRLVLACLAATVAAALGLGVARELAAPDLKVRLIVDFGDGAQKVYSALAWKKGMTLLDAMDAAKAHPHGITFAHTGKGETAFLTSIDDVKNAGGGAGSRNWQYWVNTTLGDRSFGVYPLDPGDVVCWKFTTREMP